MPLADGFVPRANLGQEFLAPLEIYWCSECKTVQTQHDVQVNDYYRKYHYTVSTSSFVQQFMRLLADNAFERFALQPGDNVVEIGSGDGSLLACFQNRGARVLGYEPSVNLCRVSRQAGVPVVEGLFTADTIQRIPAEIRPIQVALLTYTFDHLFDPLAFLQTIHDALDPERGLLIIEVHDLAKIVARREACLFAHEHSIYLTLLTMERLLARTGFKLLTSDLVPEISRRGNSLLVVAAPQTSCCQAEPLEPVPDLLRLDEWQVYGNFGQEISAAYARLGDYVRQGRRAGKRFAGYGAGGRGVLSLAMADLNQGDIAFVCDRNVNLHRLYTPRSHIPVVSPDHLSFDPVDELVVFSTGYLGEITQQLNPYLKQGMRLTSLFDLL
jgi:SAM-dependent methyltransferase